MNSSDLLVHFADNLASVVPSIDAEAEHDRWQAGIGSFEKKNHKIFKQKVERIVDR
jgi:hypothetical protein